MSNIENLKAIESGGIDFSEFEGNKKLIEDLQIVEVPSSFHESGKVQALKIVTESVTKIQDKDGKEIDLRASELVNLKVDKDGKVGYSTNPKSKLQKLMKKCKVEKPIDLKGKQVTLKVRESKAPDGSSKEFLGFYLE